MLTAAFCRYAHSIFYAFYDLAKIPTQRTQSTQRSFHTALGASILVDTHAVRTLLLKSLQQVKQTPDVLLPAKAHLKA